MKTYLIIVFFALLVITGCTKKAENQPAANKNNYSVDSSDLKTKPLDNPNEQFTLAYNYEQGKKYTYRIAQTSVDNQEMKADTVMRQSVKQNIIYIVEVSAAQKDQDGTLEMNVTFKSVKLDAQANGQNFSFESATNKDSTAKKQYAEYMSLVDNPFSVRVSKKGEILEVFRADKISNRYIELKGYADSVNAEQKTMIRNNMIQGALRPLLVQLFRQVPDHPVAKDSSWTFSQSPTQFMTYKLQNTNTFKVNNLEQYNSDKVAIIDAGMITTATGDNKATDRGVSYVINKPVTNAEGKIYFDISKGYIIKSKTKTVVNVFYTMEANGPKGKQKAQRKETIENVNFVELM